MRPDRKGMKRRSDQGDVDRLRASMPFGDAGAAGRARPSSMPLMAVLSGPLMLLTGVWLILAPFLLEYRDAGGGRSAVWNDIVVGAVVMMVALMRMAAPRATVALSLLTVALGGWLIVAPFVLAYHLDTARAAMWNDVVVGTVMVIVAAGGWRAARRWYHSQPR